MPGRDQFPFVTGSFGGLFRGRMAMQRIAMILHLYGKLTDMKKIVGKNLVRIFAAFVCTALVASCYGVPYDAYEVKGKVVDEDDNPIAGIAYEGAVGDLYVSDQMRTGEDGAFAVSTFDFGAEKMILTFIDDDEEENGGTFKPRILEVDYVKDSGKQLKVVLEKD